MQTDKNRPKNADVIIIGSGHNGLVCATILARKGLKVVVLEEKDIIGGATRTEYPFKKAPGLGASTASYLLGVMPPELISELGANLRLIRRDPHYFLPTLDGRYLLFGSDKEAMKKQFKEFFSEDDWKANEALCEEIGKIREDLAPSWLKEPLSVEETADKYIRPELRQVFIDLVKNPCEDYLRRFGFKSEMLIAMYAVTDGFSGLNGSFGTPGTGMNFLVHNMCRLPGADGTFMIAGGGMGSISDEFARLANEAGAQIFAGAGVEEITIENSHATGVVLKDGTRIRARTVVSNADPYRMRQLTGDDALGDELNKKLDAMKRTGTTMKINLALDSLPKFTCLPEDRGQYNGTVHLLPEGKDLIKRIRKGFDEVQAGRLAQEPTIEMYTHTMADPSLKDADGHHNAAFFVQWVPYELSESSWEKEEARYAEHLLDIAEKFAPGFKKSVVEMSVLTPKKIEEQFGISYGHIHHIDNTFGFDERMPYKTPVGGLYSCSAGCHPAGSVIGAAGYNSAKRILKDLVIE
ncbi:MAG TPA: NAD(P)/FAD-dependent oxidoreductase [Candidatus Saccharimonadales bacterium]|nr:NAD(P)/FAD-dependent oxidoreductase [Candidatus Saccharimonadales bacterium]